MRTISRALAISVRPQANMLRLALLVALAALLLDAVTKTWAVLFLGSDPILLAGGLMLAVTYNDAFAFSSGAGMFSPAFVFSVRAASLLLIILLASRRATVSLRSAFGFALLIAGGLGNALDLLLRDGVVDFIGIGPLTLDLGDAPVDIGLVGNLADLWVLVGVALLWPELQRVAGLLQERFRALGQQLRGRESHA